MSFHDCCENIRIEVREDHTVLLATGNNDDEYQDQEVQIVLDEQLGTIDGWFVRGDNHFTQSARDIELDIRDDGPWLVAFLSDVEGVEREPQGINLAQHIGYESGELVWVDPEE